MIDDSIVRGTTSKRLVQILRKAGVKEVHMRVSSPPYRYPCYFGMDISDKAELIATKHTIAEIKDIIGVDTLGFLSIEGLLKTLVGAKCGFCTACFTGDYPMEISNSKEK